MCVRVAESVGLRLEICEVLLGPFDFYANESQSCLGREISHRAEA
jgi:hypothetical protein